MTKPPTSFVVCRMAVVVWVTLVAHTAMASCPVLTSNSGSVPLNLLRPIILNINQVFNGKSQPYVWSLDLCNGNAPNPVGAPKPCSSPGYVMQFTQDVSCEQTFTTVESSWSWNGTAANAVFTKSNGYVMNVGVSCGDSTDLVALWPVYASQGGSGKVSWGMQLSSSAACPIPTTPTNAPAPLTPAPASRAAVLWNRTVTGIADGFVADGVVLLSSQEAEFGGFVNTIEAWNISTSNKLWSSQTFGPVDETTIGVAAPSVPNVFFLALNNLEVPNVTAVVPASGTVLWTNAIAFAQKVVAITASVDGQRLFALSFSDDYSIQLTAMDAATGAITFTQAATQPPCSTVCGEVGVSCLALYNATADTVSFVDNDGTLLGTVQLQNGSRNGRYLECLGHTVLAPSYTNGDHLQLAVVDTRSYRLLWSRDDTTPFVNTRLQNSSQGVDVIAADSIGLSGYRAASGDVRWNSTAAYLCPSRPPAPSAASAFRRTRFGPFSAGVSGGSLFSFEAECEYDGGTILRMLGVVSAVDGTLKWWRYLSTVFIPGFPLVPVGEHNFAVLDQRRQGVWSVDLYNTTQSMPFASFQWAPPGASEHVEVGAVADGQVLLLAEYFGVEEFQLSGIRLT